MAKVYLPDAHRNVVVPIIKDDWRYLGMNLEDECFINICLPIWLATGCQIFDAISQSLAWIHTKNNPHSKIFSYLDYFLILADSEHDCKKTLDSFLYQLHCLGFPLNEHKTVQSVTIVEYPGLGLDSANLQYRSFFLPLKD